MFESIRTKKLHGCPNRIIEIEMMQLWRVRIVG